MINQVYFPLRVEEHSHCPYHLRQNNVCESAMDQWYLWYRHRNWYKSLGQDVGKSILKVWLLRNHREIREKKWEVSPIPVCPANRSFKRRIQLLIRVDISPLQKDSWYSWPWWLWPLSHKLTISTDFVRAFQTDCSYPAPAPANTGSSARTRLRLKAPVQQAFTLMLRHRCAGTPSSLIAESITWMWHAAQWTWNSIRTLITVRTMSSA